MAKTNKKKILVFIPEFPVINETFIARDLEKLVALGNLDIEIAYLKRGKGDLPKNLKPKIHQVRLNLIDLFFSLKYFLLRSEKVKQLKRIIRGDLTRGRLSQYYLLLKSLGYANILKNFHPDEIHIHFYSDFSSLGMFVSLILDVPFSISAHARDVLEYPHLPKNKAKKAKFITICNKNAYERLLKISQADPQKIYLNYHGIDPKKLFPSNVESKKSEETLIFMGGSRLTEKKGIEYMIEASKILKDRGVHHKVILVGPGPLYQKLQDKIKQLDLKETFFIKGEGKGAPFSEIAHYYMQADIFVLPLIKGKFGDEDGIPNTIIEASLAELPVVTTDAGSVNELIKHEQTGIIVEQKNPQVLATEIEKLIFDEEKRKRLGSAAKEKALQMFDQEKNVRKLEELLLG